MFCGALTSHNGRDFESIAQAIVKERYRFGAMVVDAVEFVPQSRPRLFIVAVREDVPIPHEVRRTWPTRHWHTSALIGAYNKLPKELQENWLWWDLPRAPMRTAAFSDLIEADARAVEWHSEAQTKRLLDLMAPANRQKVRDMQNAGALKVGTIYKRTRPDGTGKRVQRAEIRFDDIAGCLRTPVGGSSRQILMFVEGNKIRSRLLSPREAARLMGLPDDYKLPENYNEAYHLAGDGLVVPVVRHLANHVLEPVIASIRSVSKGREAA